MIDAFPIMTAMEELNGLLEGIRDKSKRSGNVGKVKAPKEKHLKGNSSSAMITSSTFSATSFGDMLEGHEGSWSQSHGSSSASSGSPPTTIDIRFEGLDMGLSPGMFAPEGSY